MSLPTQVAETVQTAHINRHPSPAHDNNPSTAASRKEPVRLQKSKAKAGPNSPDDGGSIDDEDFVAGDDGDVEDELETEDEDLYRARSVKPRPRRHNLPPMPDLRFEQSYLWSIRNADTWWKVGWITVRDQVGSYSFHAWRSFRGIGEKRDVDISSEKTNNDNDEGYDAVYARDCVQPRNLWVALLEPQRPNPWFVDRSAVAALVVRSKQLGNTAREEDKAMEIEVGLREHFLFSMWEALHYTTGTFEATPPFFVSKCVLRDREPR